jgi:hypothetical protein
MDGNRCTKHFPKGFNSETTVDEEGFPVYKRRDEEGTLKRRKSKLIIDMSFHTTETCWSSSKLI